MNNQSTDEVQSSDGNVQPYSTVDPPRLNHAPSTSMNEAVSQPQYSMPESKGEGGCSLSPNGPTPVGHLLIVALLLGCGHRLGWRRERCDGRSGESHSP